MILSHLRLFQFRCYPELIYTPSPAINVIYGQNGQGKTSILEAIGLLALSKSFRGAKNDEMVQFNKEQGMVEALVHNNDINVDLRVEITGGRKRFLINGKSATHLADYLGRFSAVSFSPSDLEIIRGEPESRRNWIDRLSCLFFSNHIEALTSYKRVLDQRNRQLKELVRGERRALFEDFDAWTAECVKWGAEVIHNRIHSVDNSVDKIIEFYEQIAGKRENLTIEYVSNIFREDLSGQASKNSIKIEKQGFAERLEQQLFKEKKREQTLGTTLVGPHRDDLLFRFGNNEVKKFGSQGEIRSLVLAMRLAEKELHKQQKLIDPVVLIDDFSSELDQQRRHFLQRYLVEKSTSQVFLSTTERLWEDEEFAKHVEIEEGRLIERQFRTKFFEVQGIDNGKLNNERQL
ncbi:MAG: DNA replication/repair protein RecF [Bacteriovoracia bacterium]